MVVPLSLFWAVPAAPGFRAVCRQSSALIPSRRSLRDGYVTPVVDLPQHLLAFHTPPSRLSRDWNGTDGHRHRILSAASSLQIILGQSEACTVTPCW